MSGYEEKLFPASYNSIPKRLRVDTSQHPQGLPLKQPTHYIIEPEQKLNPNLDGLDNMRLRLRSNGGYPQQERMIYGKRKAFDKALMFSYQSANILKVRQKSEDMLDPKPIRALINPNKLKQDYDDKILSVGNEFNFKTGDVFEWLGTGTHWLIVLQDLTELAYFRGDIRRCAYEIAWKDESGTHSTFAAVRGPVETKINFIQKHQISIDEPNYSLHILMPQTPESLAYFKRYAKFYLKDLEVCWRVEAIDWISMPGILEINAVEYYANEQEDNNSIVGNLIVEEKNPNTIIENAAISGETFIKPKIVYEYIAAVKEKSEWKYDTRYPIEFTIDKNNPKKCYIKWLRTISGQFELSYGDYSKTIVCESLF